MNRVIDVSFKYYYLRMQECPEGWNEYNEDWYLSPAGDMLSSRSGYGITADDLVQPHLFLQLADKRWFDMNTFFPAFVEACKRRGFVTITLHVDY